MHNLFRNGNSELILMTFEGFDTAVFILYLTLCSVSAPMPIRPRILYIQIGCNLPMLQRIPNLKNHFLLYGITTS